MERMKLPSILGSPAAIAKIREKGYASYSSLKDVRDGWNGKKVNYPAFDIGSEVHSRWLEDTRLQKFGKEDELMVKRMVTALKADKLATKILTGAQVEVEFKVPILGLPILGYIDILPPAKIVGDLKTTKCTTLKSFMEQQDFLQPAIYLEATEREDFYYIGVSKLPPHTVFTFRVSKYPDKLKAARVQMKELIKYVKHKLDE